MQEFLQHDLSTRLLSISVLLEGLFGASVIPPTYSVGVAIFLSLNSSHPMSVEELYTCGKSLAFDWAL